MELVVDRLTKQYKNKIVVDRVSCKFSEGVYGLLGANGAGKTTFMRMLCNILTPTSGSVLLDGMDAGTEEYRSFLGYLPQDFGYYPNFTGLDFLFYMAALKGLEKKQAKQRIKELLEIVSLGEISQSYRGTWKGQHCDFIYSYCIRCGAYRRLYSNDERRTVDFSECKRRN